MRLNFVTENPDKILSAQAVGELYGVEIVPAPLAGIVEIQSPDDEAAIARGKAEQAFRRLESPLFVSDDTWVIPGLRGFPGPYMKDINKQFTEEDWLRLTLPLKDRRIILRQIVVYRDLAQRQIFTDDITGTLLTQIRGRHPQKSSFGITSFDDVNGESMAEAYENGRSPTAGYRTAWHSLFEWVVAQPTSQQR